MVFEADVIGLERFSRSREDGAGCFDELSGRNTRPGLSAISTSLRCRWKNYFEQNLWVA